MRFPRWSAVLVFACVVSAPLHAMELKVPDGAKPAALSRGMAEASIKAAFGMQGRCPADAKPAACPLGNDSEQKMRGGPELIKVYNDCAPSVVLIFTGQGFGAGFVVDAEKGLIVTNEHIAGRGTYAETLCKEVDIVFGKVEAGTGQIAPLGEKYKGDVICCDANTDLGLVQLRPDGLKALKKAGCKAMTFASKPAVPGQELAAIGHRGIGLLWGIKPGSAISVGRFSSNGNEVVAKWRQLNNLGASKAPPLPMMQAITAALQKKANVLFIEASCPVSGGDSGGPLLNMKSELAGVTSFGRISNTGAESANFFIHANEVKTFLKGAPKAAAPIQPAKEFWNLGAQRGCLVDGDKNGKAESLLLFAGPMLVGAAFDLDEDKAPKLTGDEFEDAMLADKVFTSQNFDYECCLITSGHTVLMAYDLDNNNWFEKIRFGATGKPQAQSELSWKDARSKVEIKKLKEPRNIAMPAGYMPEAQRKRYIASVLGLFQ